MQLKGPGSGSLSGAISGFTFLDKFDDGTWQLVGPISGPTMVDVHAGTLTLDGNNSYTNLSAVEAGTLLVNGTIATSSELIVFPGATIGGIGTVPKTTVDGGFISPGSTAGTSIGSLTVSGDLLLDNGAVYRAEIDDAGHGDLILVSGIATIGTASVDVVNTSPVFLPGTRYTILTANGGVSGSFSNPVVHLPLVDVAVTQDPNNVYLDVTRTDTPIDTVVETPAQEETGDTVQDLGPRNPLFDAVVGQTSDQAIRYALDQISGQGYASIRSSMIEDSRFIRDAINNRLDPGFGKDSVASDMLQHRFGTGGVAWLSGFGSWASRDGTSEAAGLDRSIGGLFVGGDMPINDNAVVGLVAGYGNADYDVDATGSRTNSDNYYAALYSGLSSGNWAFRTGGAYTWHDIDASRNVSFPGFRDHLTADYSAATAQIFGEAGYKFEMAQATVEPFAGAAWVNLDTDGFKEKGGPAALSVQGSSDNIGVTTLGLRASTQFELGGQRMSARGLAGWRHAFGDLDTINTAAFAGTPSFGAAGLPVAEDAAVIEVGLDADITGNVKLGLAYSGQFGKQVADNGFSARLMAKF